ncbi:MULTISPECIES: DUF4097 family beta strand repeat-containing protein [unclassified Curtobacterium]|uniref:DUF4097 family beta strand repeat-containing protein n=1 Tax=unclassified Curtobacterium TaxID=257496 RepID=UPI00277FC2F8|nr:DUF4097 family beta strand repeat-containing protein [Curtobacterium sp. 260]MDP9736084.1 hypothetical protein [Curtobacterium sp. 260]
MTTTAPPTSSTPPPAPRRPRTLRTVLLVVGSVLLVALLAVVVVQSVAASDRQDHSRTSAVDESFDRIRIETGATDVRVERVDVDRTEVVFVAGDTRLRERHAVRDGVLDLTVSGPAWSIVDLSVGVRQGAHLTVRVPEDAADVPVEVDATAGDVLLAGSWGDVALTSTAGDVTLDGRADALAVEATSGDVQLTLAAAPRSITVETTSGDQVVSLPDGDYRITAEATVGDVDNELGTDPGAAQQYRFTAVAGDVEIQRGTDR